MTGTSNIGLKDAASKIGFRVSVCIQLSDKHGGGGCGAKQVGQVAHTSAHCLSQSQALEGLYRGSIRALQGKII